MVDYQQQDFDEPRLQNAPEMAGRTLYKRICAFPQPRLESEFQEELEKLRGCQISFVDIHQIPCTEISSEVKEIRPLVSVVMLAYNHQDFLAEAIDSIVSQKTSFPFELVIGEDCSTDRTRDIVLDYQKQYPEKIRVLTAKKNCRFYNGSNWVRTLLSCRGKYIAFCEGDDYWIDERKLQKQVDILESDPSIGLVCGQCKTKYERGSCSEASDGPYWVLPNDSGNLFYDEHMIGTARFLVFTVTAMVRSSLLETGFRENPILTARLYMADLPLWYSILAQRHRWLRVDELSSVYRRHSGGASIRSKGNQVLRRDVYLARYYYWQRYFKDFSPKSAPEQIRHLQDGALRARVAGHVYTRDYTGLMSDLRYCMDEGLCSVVSAWVTWILIKTRFYPTLFRLFEELRKLIRVRCPTLFRFLKGLRQKTRRG